MDHLNVSAAEASKLRGNVPLAIFGLALIVIAIAAPGGIQGLLRRAGRWMRARLVRTPHAPASPPPVGPRPATEPEGNTTSTPTPTHEVTT
jgi:hypothetical protein